MASTPTFEADEWMVLTRPISDFDPAGPDRNRVESIQSRYHAIADMRVLVADAERNLSWGQQTNLDVPKKWREIKTSTQEYLSRTAKDLNVSVYLTEALVRLHGFIGLSEGLALSAALLDRFGDIWKQRLEADDDASTVLGLLSSAIGGAGRGQALLRPPILATPLSDAANNPPNWAAHIVARDPTRPQAINSAGTVKTLAAIEADIRGASREFIDNLRDDLAAAADSGRALQESLNRFAAGSAPLPSCATIIELLIEIRTTVVALVGERRPLLEGSRQIAEIAIRTEGQTKVDQAGAVAVAGAAGYADREQAFRQLLLIAEYFRTTDPQSLIAPALEEIVRRGRLPWHELLSELLPDDKARASFLLGAGIRSDPAATRSK